MTNYSPADQMAGIAGQDVAPGRASLADCDYKLEGQFLINQINSLV